MENLPSISKFGRSKSHNTCWLAARIASARPSMPPQRYLDPVALEELIAGLAHELNNPLSVIVGQALLLQETAGDARTVERARKIAQAADRSARIINSILAMARQDPVETTRVDVNQIIRDALELREEALRAPGIRVSLSLANNLPPVCGDGCQLGQVVTNLLVNAQQAMEEIRGPRHLKVISAYCRQKRQVIVKVKDNGPGVPAAIRSCIFDPFFTSKDIGVGTGIGLALSKRIIEAHAGSISLVSGEENGAAFALHLPVNPVSEYEPQGSRLDQSALNCHSKSRAGLRRKSRIHVPSYASR